MFIESNQEGFRRRGGTRNGPKGLVVFGYLERKLGRPCKQENIMRNGRHVCLGSGWARSGDCGKRRVHGKKQRTGRQGKTRQNEWEKCNSTKKREALD